LGCPMFGRGLSQRNDTDGIESEGAGFMLDPLSGKHDVGQRGLQSNRTINCTVHWAEVQRPQLPVILVFQSVDLSSKRQTVLPPLEIVVQGLSVPGVLATRQPAGIGTWQFRLVSPLPMPKLQDRSVVAGKLGVSCAMARGEVQRSHPEIRQTITTRGRRSCMRQIVPQDFRLRLCLRP